MNTTNARLKMSIFAKTIIWMALLLNSSCGENGDVKEPYCNSFNCQDYFPLQVGNYWELAFLPKRTIEIIETIDNKDYYGMVSEEDTTYYRMDGNGKVYQRTKATEEILKFDFAADEGQTWTYEANNYSYTWYATLTSKNDTITIGNHSFPNCYRFYFDIPQMADEEHIIWFAPGLGFIEESYPGGTADRKVLTKVKIDDVEMQF